MTGISRTVLLSASVALASLAPAIAHGDGERRERKEDSGQEAARALNKQAKARYKLTEYDSALTLFKQAYELYPEPSILFNIGQTYRKLHQYEKAIDAFTNYLTDAPEAPDRGKVEERIAELKELAAAEKASDGKPPTDLDPKSGDGVHTRAASLPAGQVATRDKIVGGPAGLDNDLHDLPPPPRFWYENWWGWTLTGTGAVALGFGIGFLVDASNLDSRVDMTPEGAMRDDLRAQASSHRTIGTITTVAGSLLLVGGVTFFILNPQPHHALVRSRKEPVGTAFFISPGGVGLRGWF